MTTSLSNINGELTLVLEEMPKVGDMIHIKPAGHALVEGIRFHDRQIKLHFQDSDIGRFSQWVKYYLENDPIMVL